MSAREPAQSNRPSRRPTVRDQEESAFSFILRDLVQRVPGAYAAALVAQDGESVDYYARVDPFDVKVAAATWRIAVAELAQLAEIGHLRSLVVRARHRSTIVRVLPEGYALVVLLHRRAFPSVGRAFDACERALAVEAEWPLSDVRPQWVGVQVETDRRRRPVWLSMGTSLSCSVEVLGSLVGLRGRERGYRVRLSSGHELNLVREAGGRWYADERSS